MNEPTDVQILEFIVGELASPLSSLSERFELSQDEMKSRLQSLISLRLVRAQGIVEGPDPVYSLTQDGAKELEKSVKKGLSAYI